jgi:hypothetical protein
MLIEGCQRQLIFALAPLLHAGNRASVAPAPAARPTDERQGLSAQGVLCDLHSVHVLPWPR